MRRRREGEREGERGSGGMKSLVGDLVAYY